MERLKGIDYEFNGIGGINWCAVTLICMKWWHLIGDDISLWNAEFQISKWEFKIQNLISSCWNGKGIDFD